MPEEARSSVARNWALLDWRVRVGDSARWAVGGGLALVAAYAVLRTVAAPEPVLLAWTALAAAVTVASPLAGLTVLAAIGPFTEALTDEGRITAVPYLLAALGAGVLVALGRLALARELPRPSLPIVFGAVLFVGTLLAVGVSAVLHGPPRGFEALQLWVPGIGGGLTVLFAAWLVGRRGNVWPLVVVAASIGLAALLSVADVVLDGAVRAGPTSWLLRAGMVGERLGGVIPAPNAFAAILLLGFALGVAALAFQRSRSGRIMGALSIAPIAPALALTLSRSALLGLAVAAGILAWRWRPLAGVLVLAGAAVAAVLATPSLLGARAVMPTPGLAPGAFHGDVLRLEGWATALQMTVERPLTGHGFRSFEWLHSNYAATIVDAPHNEFLRFFAEGGVIVGAAGIGFALATVITLLRTTSWITAGCAAAAGALFVMASFNNPFLYVQVNGPAFIVLGIGLGLAQCRAPPGREQLPPRQGGSELA